MAATRTPSTLPCSFTSVSSALSDPWMIFIAPPLAGAASIAAPTRGERARTMPRQRRDAVGAAQVRGTADAVAKRWVASRTNARRARPLKRRFGCRFVVVSIRFALRGCWATSDGDHAQPLEMSGLRALSPALHARRAVGGCVVDSVVDSIRFGHVSIEPRRSTSGIDRAQVRECAALVEAVCVHRSAPPERRGEVVDSSSFVLVSLGRSRGARRANPRRTGASRDGGGRPQTCTHAPAEMERARAHPGRQPRDRVRCRDDAARSAPRSRRSASASTSAAGTTAPGSETDRDAYDKAATYFLAVLPDEDGGAWLLGSARVILGESRARIQVSRRARLRVRPARGGRDDRRRPSGSRSPGWSPKPCRASSSAAS